MSDLRRLTLPRLAAQLRELRERVEDLEDARDLEAAIERNEGQLLIPWSEIEAEVNS